jgi:hypothetical protein
MAGDGWCCSTAECSDDGVGTGAFGTTAGLDREWRRRELKPSFEVMVGCSIVGEPS